MNLNLRLGDLSEPGRRRVESASSSLELENIEDSDEGLLLRGGPTWSLSSALPSPTQPSAAGTRPMPPAMPLPLPSPRLSIPLGQQTTGCTSPNDCTLVQSIEPCSPGSTYSPFEVDFPGGGVGYDSAAVPQGPMGGDWRPMRPGYALPPDADYPSLQAIKRAAELESSGDMESGLRQTIPVMPRPLAIACFVLNVIWPGLGTLIAGLSVLCCSRPRSPYTSRSSVVWSNIWVSFLQLMTTGLLLLGWIWSIAWGASFVNVSRQYVNTDLSRNGHATDGPSGGTITEPTGEGVAQSTTTAPTTSASNAHPTTTSSSSLPPSNDAFLQPSIIVLHQSPFIAHAAPTTLCPWIQGNHSAYSPPEMTSRTRHSRRRSWGVYPEMLLAPGALETIVVRNGTFFVRETSTIGGRDGLQEPPELTIDHFASKASITRTTSHQ